MTPIEEARDVIIALASLTSGLRNGDVPSPYRLLAYQGDLVRLYLEVGQEKSQKFKAKESAYLERKIKHADHFLQNKETNLTVAQCTEEAVKAVRKEKTDENERAFEFDQYVTMLQSIRNAFEHTRSVVSFLKEAENKPSNHP
jgi:hypothetical protein